MRKRTIVAAVTLCASSIAMSAQPQKAADLPYAGTWKLNVAKTSAPTVIELKPSGADGLTIRMPDSQINCEAKFDGKDYPATGPTVPPGLTLALTKSGPRSFELTEKQHGKPIANLSFTESADGKTLTETGGAPGSTEKFKAVYERQ